MRANESVNFTTIDTQSLGVYNGVNVVTADCNYSLAVSLDNTLPNTYNAMIVAKPELPTDPRAGNYVVVENNGTVRAIEMSWIIPESIEVVTVVPDRTFIFHNLDNQALIKLRNILTGNGYNYKEL